MDSKESSDIRSQQEAAEKQNPPVLLSIDVESIGLHGVGYAIAGVLFATNGLILDRWTFAVDPSTVPGTDEDRVWNETNVPRLLPTDSTVIFCSGLHALHSAAWRKIQEAKRKGAVIMADCGWPVEANFLSACVADDPSRAWEGPYPLADVATLMLARGMDPTATRERLADELPVHHPEKDALQSGRLWMQLVHDREYATIRQPRSARK